MNSFDSRFCGKRIQGCERGTTKVNQLINFNDSPFNALENYLLLNIDTRLVRQSYLLRYYKLNHGTPNKHGHLLPRQSTYVELIFSVPDNAVPSTFT